MHKKYLLLGTIFLFLISLNFISATTTGGTITYDGAYTIHTFTANDTFNTTSTLTAEVLIVAGGGAGGGDNVGGGGGAGGLKYNSSFTITSGSYNVIVGYKGLGTYTSGATGGNGGNSSFNGIVAAGGGGGANNNVNQGATGGSGGGSTWSIAGGAGISGQGYAGGTGSSISPYAGGSGGGASSAGGDGVGGTGGIAGQGYNSSINGSIVCYSEGGTGGVRAGGTTGNTYCGAGKGLVGANTTGQNATGYGNGGGGAGLGTATGGNGGSGVVIVRYLTAGASVIVINSTTPLNSTYTSNTAPQFTFNISLISNTWNTTLYINGTSYGTNNSITTTGIYSIIASPALTANAQYSWYINATSGTISSATETRYIYITGTGGSTSCVKQYGTWWYRPTGCNDA